MTTINQFYAQGDTQGLILPNQTKHSISVVIAKPTRVCNADCSYCSSPPLEEMGSNWEPEWNFDSFKTYFDKIFPHMMSGGFWIWHGGEPMLMGPDFYHKTYEYAKKRMKEAGKTIYFSMQSNLLGYNKKWTPVFKDIFHGSISTSFDPDETNRTIKKDPKTYTKVFKRVMTELLEDGFRPLVIGVYSEETAPLMHSMYDWSKSLGDKSFPLRFNYCHPTGRYEKGGEAIKPETYGKYLIEMYNKWIQDAPNFIITPLDQMFIKTLGLDGEGHCPWTSKCGGRFLGIEPNGEIFNCSDFADLGKEYSFGNLNNSDIPELMNSSQAKAIKRRRVQLPTSCKSCEHFDECEGGCARDSALYHKGLYGKFHYCKSWKMVFSRIKESIINGEADHIIEKYGKNPSDVKNLIKLNLNNHFNEFSIDWESISTKGFLNPFGIGDNFLDQTGPSNYNEFGEFLPYKQEEEAFKEFNENPHLLAINTKLAAIPIKLLD